jgi:phosphopantothenoylcysteine synthetase/decarboxylase
MLVGFALETATGEELARLAAAKLQRKRVDLVVANAASESLGGEQSRAMLVDSTGAEALETMGKAQLADRILDRVARRWKAGR